LYYDSGPTLLLKIFDLSNILFTFFFNYWKNLFDIIKPIRLHFCQFSYQTYIGQFGLLTQICNFIYIYKIFILSSQQQTINHTWTFFHPDTAEHMLQGTLRSSARWGSRASLIPKTNKDGCLLSCILHWSVIVESRARGLSTSRHFDPHRSYQYWFIAFPMTECNFRSTKQHPLPSWELALFSKMSPQTSS